MLFYMTAIKLHLVFVKTYEILRASKSLAEASFGSFKYLWCSSIVDVWQNPKYASAGVHNKNLDLIFF